MRNAVLWLLASAAAASAAGFDGVWDAVIVANGFRVPFRMELTASPARVCFFEDTQPVCSTSAKTEGGQLIARWDYLNTELRLTPHDGQLTGGYRNVTAKQEIGIEARRHAPSAPASEPPANVGGTWEIHSTERPTVRWQLLLRQSGAELKGTVLRVDGDVGALVGRISGKHFLLGHFAGDRPTAVEGTLLPDGTLDLMQNNSKLYALRPAAARARNLEPPPDPATYAKARNPAEPFRFRFPNLNGETVTEARFAGRPFIVTITGSWCPNCRDEAPFLSELYKQYHGAGLEIVGFCFETEDDRAYPMLRAFMRKFGIEYPMVLAGDPAKLKAAVPQIDNLSAFPTSIYVGRDGLVRSVHTGFPSVGSGEEQTRVKHELRTLVERMLADPVPPTVNR